MHLGHDVEQRSGGFQSVVERAQLVYGATAQPLAESEYRQSELAEIPHRAARDARPNEPTARQRVAVRLELRFAEGVAARKRHRIYSILAVGYSAVVERRDGVAVFQKTAYLGIDALVWQIQYYAFCVGRFVYPEECADHAVDGGKSVEIQLANNDAVFRPARQHRSVERQRVNVVILP